MISYAEALTILREIAGRRRLREEDLPVAQAMGRIVARPIHSPEEVPSFDNSAMDGFAVHAAATSAASPQQPVRLQVAGTIMAGNRPIDSGDLGQAWEIMTGAPMPKGAPDGVIKVEEVEVTRDHRGHATEVVIRRPVAAGENVRERGEDFRTGQVVIERGVRLMPEHLMALASLGVTHARVLSLPRIALISTGDELVPHETRELRPGMIRNSTGPYLAAAAGFFGAEARTYGVVGDSVDDFLELIERVRADTPDLILTTGAVSMGKHDFVPEALARLGARVHYHKVAIRPGKPGIFAELPDRGGALGPAFLGSPGNPISTAVALRFFVWPYLRALQGLSPEQPTRARLALETPKPEGLRCFFKARRETDESGQRVHALKGQPSFMVSPLLDSDAWVVFPEPGRAQPAGSVVEVYPLYPRLKEGASA